MLTDPALLNPVLVCAPDPSGEPRVVIADGSYESGDERVFWRRTRDDEVLRVPLRTEVSVRPVRSFSDRVPQQRSAVDGEQRLMAAVATQRAQVPTARRSAEDGRHVLLRRRLADALLQGDAHAAESAASELWRRHGLAEAHAQLAGCLADLGTSWAAGLVSVRAERPVTAAVRAVLERMRAASRGRTSGEPVVLLSPSGDRHTLALAALAHQVVEAGRPALVMDDLPLDELGELLRETPVVAVVVSAHLPLGQPTLRELVATVRSASPRTLVVVGGPGAPRAARGVDLVTDDPARLLELLEDSTSVLTARERQVLRAVADGRTNNEIAHTLGLSAATVKTHLDHVFAKTGTEHRAAAVARALRQGWIT